MNIFLQDTVKGKKLILDHFDIFKAAGCEESAYPVTDEGKKCWHFVKATRDYGFIEGAYDALESSAQDIRILEVAVFSLIAAFLL